MTTGRILRGVVKNCGNCKAWILHPERNSNFLPWLKGVYGEFMISERSTNAESMLKPGEYGGNSSSG
jgi:hypothetical protein